MSTMEKRLQLLLDQERYQRVSDEARRSGRSVAAVIREAIDLRFSNDTAQRRAAGEALLAATRDPDGTEPDWSETKAAIEEDLDRFNHIAQGPQ